jgi:hypothetical protein
MTTLCTGCSSKKPSHISGSCMGNPNGTPCGASTTSYDFKLCDPCSTALGQCSWCQKPLNGTSGSTTVAAGIVFVTARDTDNGKKFSMKVQEQVHIVLDEDSWSGVEWAVDSCDAGLHAQIGTIFTPDPTNYQYGTRQFIIDIRNAASGQTGKIRLHEVTRTYYGWYGQQGGQPTANGKKWTCDVAVS